MKKIILLTLLFSSLMQFTKAQWQQTNFPNGVSVFCSAISDTNIFVGTDSGIFLTVNNGRNWTKVNNEKLKRYVF